MKVYPKYKPSGVDWLGEIPSDWIVSKIKFVSHNLDANRMPLNQETRLKMQGKYPYYGATGIIDYIDKYLIDGEFILVGEDGAPFTIPNRDVAFEAKGKIWVNNHAHIIKGKKKYRQTFLIHSLNIVDYSKYVQGSTREKLTQSDLANIPLLDIPFFEQQKIVDFLDYKTGQCDRFISNRQKQIELLNEQKAAIINKAVTKGINPNAKMKPSGIEWIGDIPEHWKVKRPASFGRFLKGSGISKSDLVENGVPVILYGDIYTKYNLIAEHIFNFISQELASNSKPIYKGDLLFTGSGETREDIGKCIVYNGETKAYAGGDLMIFRQKTNSSLFLAYSFSTNYAITKKAMNSRGDIIIHIYASALRDIYIPIPSLSEQQGIIDFIKKETSKIENLISKYQKQIELMQEYRTALISQAVTGKIDVRDWKPPTK